MTARNTSWSGQRRSFPTATRQAILHRDGYRCVDCGHHDPTGQTLRADHITPHAEGGTDHITNGATRCDDCHERKTRTEQARGRDRRTRRLHQPDHPHPGLRTTQGGG